MTAAAAAALLEQLLALSWKTALTFVDGWMAGTVGVELGFGGSKRPACPPRLPVCSGYLPPQISQLATLQFLSLGSNQFEGALVQQR